MYSALFRVDLRPPLAVITYTRPPINMLSFATLGQLEEFLRLSERKDLGVIVLTGGVEGCFAAHADTEDVMRMENGQPPVRPYFPCGSWNSACRRRAFWTRRCARNGQGETVLSVFGYRTRPMPPPGESEAFGALCQSFFRESVDAI